MHTEVSQAGRLEISFYTDPLCCWSWAFEPQWRRLQYEFRGSIVFRYVMSGLLPSWKNYSDPVYSISRPMQMGPVWHEAALTSGMQLYDKIWVEDPPASSYPACIAVKCAELQSPGAGAKYLRLLREAVMLNGKNIAKMDVLTDVAQHLSPGMIALDKFSQDLINDTGLEAFRKDLNEVQSRGINRFPSLIIRGANKAVMITGYRPYDVLLDAIKQVAPDLNSSSTPLVAEDYTRYWESLTTREMEEILV